MTEIENEGRVYVLKSEVENIIKERVSKVAQRATLAEKALEDAESRLSKAEKAMSSVDILNQQLQEMQGKLSTAEKRFDRYQSISKHGLTDPDLVEAIEWSYERAQKGVSDKERLSLSEWLDNQVQSPENAPITIRPHLQALKMLADETDAPETQQSTEEYTYQEQPQTYEAPKTNVEAISAELRPELCRYQYRLPREDDLCLPRWSHRRRSNTEQ